jgi:uncharacterized protein (DUF1015 family)
MAHIVPFRALRYDPAQVALSDVVTQPYDKITKQMQERYYAASPYNLVRIILGKPEPADGPSANAYTRATACYRDWRRRGIFRQDSEQSIYQYTQRFQAPGSALPLERRGFIALGKIEDYSAGIVFRHEQTLAQPKADRLELLRATRAHFGQLFMLYSDPAREIDQALATAGEPVIDFADEFGVAHQVTRISDPNLLSLVQDRMREKKLMIADGHHRYETALTYRNERRAAEVVSPERPFQKPLTPADPPKLAFYDFAMMTFVNMDSPGLVILPTHRLVHGLASFSVDGFRDRARAYFSVEEVDPSINPARAQGILREAGHAGPALLAVAANRAFLLDTPRALGSRIFDGFSLRQQSLDVVQLHKCLLEGVLEISEEAIRNQQNLSYVRDTGEALAQVRAGAANILFLMNPVRMRQVRDIAFAGEVLPQKSTDFYPKLLSGLTIYALD